MCEHCVKPTQNGEIVGNIKPIIDEGGVVTYLENGVLHVDITTDFYEKYLEIKINYCPICGKKLEDK